MLLPLLPIEELLSDVVAVVAVVVCLDVVVLLGAAGAVLVND